MTFSELEQDACGAGVFLILEVYQSIWMVILGGL